MVLTEDQKQVKALLTETITLLCKNGLHFRSEFSIDGLIGITLDQDNVFLVSIKETIKCDSSGQNNDLVHMSQTKTESAHRMSPSQSRGRRHPRTSELATSDKTSAAPQNRSNFPSGVTPPEENCFRTRSEMTDVKLEFSSTDTQDRCRSEYEESSVAEEAFSGAAMSSNARHTRAHDVTQNDSDASVRKDAATSRHCEEPSLKRLRSGEHKKTNESLSSIDHDGEVECRDNAAPVSRVCKAEPLDVVEIPDDEMESSLNSDNSYLMYMSMYGSGADGGAMSTDASYSAQYDMSQMTPHSSIPGCSTWGPAPRNSNVFNNQDKTAANSLIENRSPPAHHVTKCPAVSAAPAADRRTQPPPQPKQRRPGEDLLHMLYRHGRYVCQLCGKRMPRERDLKAHMASKHFMAKDFRCKLCGAEYGYKYNLQQHMKIKHRLHLSDLKADIDS